MRSKHPLQRFLDRHGLSQTEMARAVDTSRETVNRWVRGRNLPVGENLIRALGFAKRFEDRLEAHELFPPSLAPRRKQVPAPDLDGTWGEACPICEVPWNEATEHLPLALLHAEIGNHPAGGLCEGCARRTGSDPTEDRRKGDTKRTLR